MYSRSFPVLLLAQSLWCGAKIRPALHALYAYGYMSNEQRCRRCVFTGGKSSHVSHTHHASSSQADMQSCMLVKVGALAGLARLVPTIMALGSCQKV